MNTVERTRPLLVFNHLVNQTEYHVRVHSLTKQTKINELPAEQLTECSLNVWFVYSPKHKWLLLHWSVYS
ncbi:hypothetical protein Hanom_Chr06g00502881 [Helianthus anomalus]